MTLNNFFRGVIYHASASSVLFFFGTQVLTVAVVRAATTKTLDLNVYLPACQPSFSATAQQLQVRVSHR